MNTLDFTHWHNRPRRLDRILRHARLGSYQEIAVMLQHQRVTLDGNLVREPWILVDPTSEVLRVDEKPIPVHAPQTYALLHKPEKVLSAMRDPHQRKTLGDILPPNWREHVGHAGRLDRATTGALILSDDGDLIHLLTEPVHKVWKTYRVTIADTLGPQDERLKQLQNGVLLKALGHTTLPARAHTVPGSSRPYRKGTQSDLILEIREGKNRQIRRMIRAVGIDLLHLHREAIGSLSLGDLKPGERRPLTNAEISDLYRDTGGKSYLYDLFHMRLTERMKSWELSPREQKLVEKHLKRLEKNRASTSSKSPQTP